MGHLPCIALLALAAAALPAQTMAEVAGALAAGSYFPIDLGNRWVFRLDSRFETGGHETWRVDRTGEAGGKTYAVFSILGSSGVIGESWFRADSQGPVYQLIGVDEQLFLDARPARKRSGTLSVLQVSFLDPCAAGLRITFGIL